MTQLCCVFPACLQAKKTSDILIQEYRVYKRALSSTACLHSTKRIHAFINVKALEVSQQALIKTPLQSDLCIF